MYEMFSRIEPHDIIYIKSKPPGKRLFIKAVGIAQDKPDGGKVKVEWLVRNSTCIHDISEEEWRYNVYNLTLYEEMNPTIRWKIKGLLDSAREQKR